MDKALHAVDYNDRVVKGLRKFTTFLEELRVIDYHLADDWRRLMKIKKRGVRDIFVNDNEIREAYEVIKQRGEEKRVLFELLVYSGIRLTHAVQLVNTFNYQKVYIVNEKVARYPLFAFSKGKKRGFWAYAAIKATNGLKEQAKWNAEQAQNIEALAKQYKPHWSFTFPSGSLSFGLTWMDLVVITIGFAVAWFARQFLGPLGALLGLVIIAGWFSGKIAGEAIGWLIDKIKFW
ncbi:integrase [Thermococcus barophilus]|uniref:Integrase SSV1 C-terminal domain-containing protein n=1 Tax=Thermococcus barophilus TaxID=55802 RepID=A0A0S1XAR4_THEBA|nr:integrase [Thermococcus barophilus]ALM74836.1 hypothetical protein TBCH5v1_0883 [Thermococcus barophilus]